MLESDVGKKKNEPEEIDSVCGANPQTGGLESMSRSLVCRLTPQIAINVFCPILLLSRTGLLTFGHLGEPVVTLVTCGYLGKGPRKTLTDLHGQEKEPFFSEFVMAPTALTATEVQSMEVVLMLRKWRGQKRRLWTEFAQKGY